MKIKKIPGSAMNLLLAWLTAFTSISCLITGFALEIENWAAIAVITAVFAFVSLAVLRLRFGAPILLVLLLAAYLIMGQTKLDSFEHLLYTVTRRYDSCYGWGYIRWSSNDSLVSGSYTPALTLIGCAVTVPILWTLQRKKWVGVALIPGMLPLAACFILTDTLPSPVFLLILLTALLLMTMTQLTRRSDPKAAWRLTALITIPAVLFATLTVNSAQKDPHRAQADQLLTALVEIFDAGDTAGLMTSPSAPKHQVDLSTLGPNNPGNTEVMTVNANYTGVIYLRGRSYSSYTGTSWADELDTVSEGGWPTSGLADQGSVTLKLKSRQSLRYFPYYVASESWTESLKNGGFDNPNRKTEYSFSWMTPTAGTAITYTPLSSKEEAAYTDLPGSTAQSAGLILDELLKNAGSDQDRIVSAIRNYVRDSASYDLNTAAMPEDASDFAIWFLTDSDTGYCVHFASAATVLLRAAGIPARYVSGYIAYTIPGVDVPVTEKQAHAWVEYLDEDQGWTVLEATPGAESIPEIPTAPSEETTLPSEETTVPSETTRPTVNETRPQQTQPAATQPQTTAPTEEPTVPLWEQTWFPPVMWTLLAIAAVFLQYGLRRRLRKKWLSKGSKNQRALRRWKYARHLARLTRQKLPEYLQILAEKAAFSQHTITAEELREFTSFISSAQRKLTKRPWPISLFLRLIFAI